MRFSQVFCVLLVCLLLCPSVGFGAPRTLVLSKDLYCNLGGEIVFLVSVYNTANIQNVVDVSLSSPGEPVAFWSCVGCPEGKIGAQSREYILDPLEEAKIPVRVSCLGVGMYHLTVTARDATGSSSEIVVVNVLPSPEASGFSRAPGMLSWMVVAVALASGLLVGRE